VRHPGWGVPGLPMLLASAIMAMCFGLAIFAGRLADRQTPLPDGETQTEPERARG
jgi:hypothetical protein